jgi:hypothetical protein
VTKSIVGITIVLAFVAGIRLAQGDPNALLPAIAYTIYALNEKQINRRVGGWSKRIMQRLNRDT